MPSYCQLSWAASRLPSPVVVDDSRTNILIHHTIVSSKGLFHIRFKLFWQVVSIVSDSRNYRWLPVGFHDCHTIGTE
jgi:hypothetical protein